MKISVILAHPCPGSFNHAIAGTVTATLTDAGHQVQFHDLYAEKFDPLLPCEEIPRGAVLPAAVAQHCREIAAADGIVFIHPNWWGMPPAILKGWVDRVLRPGVAYRFSETDSGEGVPAVFSVHGRYWSSIRPTLPAGGSWRCSVIPSIGSGGTASSPSAVYRPVTGRCSGSWSPAATTSGRRGFPKCGTPPAGLFPLVPDPFRHFCEHFRAAHPCLLEPAAPLL